MVRIALLVLTSARLLSGAGDGQLLKQALPEFTFSCTVTDRIERCLPSREPIAGLPSELSAGKVYVLNKPLPGGLSEMSFVELPRRLRRAGCKVTSQPRSPKDLLFGSSGEPIFTIRCRCGGRSLQLRNRYNDLIDGDAALRRVWSTSDLTIQVE